MSSRLAVFLVSILFPTSLLAQGVGMNLTWVNDWATTYVFVDAFKASRPWISHRPSDGTWDSGEPFDLDEHGWVRSLADDQHAGTLMVIEQGEHLPSGEYVVLYEGEGAMVFDFDATVVSEEPGRIVLDVQPGDETIGGIHLKITETNPDDYIRNIRVVMPGFESTYEQQPFHPDYVDWLKQFHTIRFMDWGEITQDPPGEWAQRPKQTDARQSSTDGVALEYMVEMANAVGSDPWICIPHRATDEYVRNAAELIRDTLDPSLKVFIEHSNEVWNPEYPENAYAVERGEALGIAPGDSYLGMLRYHSQRSVEIFDTFEEAFGGTDRIVRVMGAQIDTDPDASTWFAQQVLGWQNAFEKTDAYAVAPYFGYRLGTPDFAAELATISEETLLDSLTADMRRMVGVGEELRAALSEYGVDLVTYEAGMGMVPSGSQVENEAAVETFNSANRNSRMYDIYAEYLAGWAESGGRMLLYTDIRRFDKWGSYGHLERLYQPLSEAHKFRAVADFLGSQNSSTAKVGDFDSSGRVDFEDFLLFASAFGGTEPLFDLDESGRVDFQDFLVFASNFGS